MTSFSSVNWFRFMTIVALSILTSMIFMVEDGTIETVEVVRTILHGLIAGFAFLQCPEAEQFTSKEKTQ